MRLLEIARSTHLDLTGSRDFSRCGIGSQTAGLKSATTIARDILPAMVALASEQHP